MAEPAPNVKPVRKPMRFTSKAQYDWFERYKSNDFRQIQSDPNTRVDRESLPERLHPKDMNVIYIPTGNGKVFEWR